MKFDNPKSVIELAQKYQLKVIGNKEQLAFGINEIHKVTLGDITFVDVEKYYNIYIDLDLVGDMIIGYVDKTNNKSKGFIVEIINGAFDADKLVENFKAIHEVVVKAKPATAKGTYMTNLSITTTQGVGIKVDPSSF